MERSASRLCRVGLCLMMAAFVGCANPKARNVAFDPFVPSALLKRDASAAQSVAYRGALLDATTVTTEEHKEVVILER